MFAICLGFGMITLDATIVNVALGPVVAHLGGSVSAAQWIVNGYTLAFAALLLTAGALADRIGARRGYLIGLVVFATGSGLCSVAGSLDVLIAARVIQGAGAAWLMPCSLALIAHMHPEPTARRRALAIWGGVSGLGLASGPVLGGVLTAVVGWRAIFLVNLPVALLAVVWMLGRVQETDRRPHPLDGVGQLLAMLSLTLVTGGFIVAGERGWTNVLALGLLGGGLIGAGALVWAERVVRRPMLDRTVLGAAGFSISVGIGLIFNFCLYGALFCLALDLAQTHRLSALETGVAMLPVTVVVGSVALLSGQIVARVGEWAAIAAGLTVGAVGAVCVALAPTDGPVWILVLCTVVLGPVSMAMSAMTATAMAGAPKERLGLASGLLNTARQVGGALGVAALGALLRVDGNVSLHVAFGAIAGMYLVGVALAVRGWRRSRAERPVSAAKLGTLSRNVEVQGRVS